MDVQIKMMHSFPRFTAATGCDMIPGEDALKADCGAEKGSLSHEDH